jgi:hypothetical protein
MNYMEARELSDHSGWRMTIRNDDRIWTHSCCREQVPATQEDVDRNAWMQMDWPKLGELIDGEPHPAHATREEAEECYHQWRLRKIEDSLEFDDAVFGDWQGCQAILEDQGEKSPRCDKPTKGGARYRDDHHPEQIALCPDHRDSERVLGQVGRVTSSWYS